MMTKMSFKKRLKQNNLSLKDFSQFCGVSYSTVLNWNGVDKPIPIWVESWLDLYEKANKYDEIISRINC